MKFGQEKKQENGAKAEVLKFNPSCDNVWLHYDNAAGGGSTVKSRPFMGIMASRLSSSTSAAGKSAWQAVRVLRLALPRLAPLLRRVLRRFSCESRCRVTPSPPLERYGPRWNGSQVASRVATPQDNIHLTFRTRGPFTHFVSCLLVLLLARRFFFLFLSVKYVTYNSGALAHLPRERFW